MEYCWTEYREMETSPQGGDDQFRVQTINRIRLHGSKSGGNVKFNCEDNVGYWYYVWVNDGPSPRGYIFIEFKASHKQRNMKRHCLVQTTENTFELLPSDNALYQVDDYWNHCKEVHQNAYPIVMQRLQVPRLPYEWSDPTKRDGAEEVCSNATGR